MPSPYTSAQTAANSSLSRTGCDRFDFGDWGAAVTVLSTWTSDVKPLVYRSRVDATPKANGRPEGRPFRHINFN
jgi:hypothetical protein